MDSRACACFLNEKFAKLHNIPLVHKVKLVHVKVIDGRPLSSGKVTHEALPIEVTFERHHSTIIFNIIRTPSNSVILGLLWLERYNPHIDWKSYKISFSIEKPILKSKFIKPSLIRARAFIKAKKHGTSFMIYATPTRE